VKKREITVEVFFALLRAGLWEHSIHFLPFVPVDFKGLYQLAEEQSAVGIIAAGLEHIEDMRVSKIDVLPFMKKVFSLENRNSSMNSFISKIMVQMKKAGISSVLLKGQGIAACYKRPEWRAAGDVDFLFDERNLALAKSLFYSLSNNKQCLDSKNQHLGLTIDSWEVELHGNLHTGISRRIDSVLDSIQRAAFTDYSFSLWGDGESSVAVLNPDDNAVFIFTHFLKHFYKGGLGLRQICDWCRLLWTYRGCIDKSILERRLNEMRLVSEWKAFAAFVVDDLGMPVDSMPLYDSSRRWSRKALRIRAFILDVGNFGHNRDMDYYGKYPFLIRKAISFGRRLSDSMRHIAIFPLDSLRFLPQIVLYGLRLAARGDSR
jgi:hypothetical protein